MSRTYKAQGIILKGMPFKEADRLVTILTPEVGIVRAIAPGARKHRSKLRGKTELFVVNEFLIVKGKSLDKVTQAETLESYPGLSRDLSKLAASQYLAELALCIGLSNQPQSNLYELLNEHLRRLSKLPLSQTLILSHLTQGIFHLLALGGVCPQVHSCCHTRRPLKPNFNDPYWRVGFSLEAGGTFSLVSDSAYRNTQLRAVELALLQQLASTELSSPAQFLPPAIANSSLDAAWIKIEQLLRRYTQYQLGKSIRSATLLDSLLICDF